MMNVIKNKVAIFKLFWIIRNLNGLFYFYRANTDMLVGEDINHNKSHDIIKRGAYFLVKPKGHEILRKSVFFNIEQAQQIIDMENKNAGR